MIVILRMDIDDDTRRAIRHGWGKKGLATRKEILSEAWGVLETYFDDKMVDMGAEIEAEESRRKP